MVNEREQLIKEKRQILSKLTTSEKYKLQEIDKELFSIDRWF